MARWAVLAVVGAIVSVPGCGSKTAKPILLGGNAGQRALMHRILDGMGATELSKISIVPATRPWRGSRDRAVMLRATAPRPGVRSKWEAQVVAAVFTDQSAATGLPPVVAVQYHDGREALESTQAKWQPPRGNQSDAKRLRTRVLTSAEKAKAAVSDLKMPLPYGLTLAVVLRVSDPAAFLHHRLERFLLDMVRGRWQREGDYFEVVDLNGKSVWAWGTTTRLSSGILRVDPRLEGCDPVTHLSVPSNYNPPPCPA